MWNFESCMRGMARGCEDFINHAVRSAYKPCEIQVLEVSLNMQQAAFVAQPAGMIFTQTMQQGNVQACSCGTFKGAFLAWPKDVRIS